ncbi:MAG TPA: insulinase family protein [Fluviicoccus sp.]|nr:insulinase family protein [Fluviicoccus sp.]
MSVHPAFESLRSVPVPSLNLVMEEYRHRVTGARHYHLAADNPENVFLVALRTMPMDSTGVAHILEHTALCGSQKYPVRDPFFLMIRRSLNTFMNAFTSSDWTAYPFASQNRQDFDNLLSVYLDAVFFSRLDPLDFAQEGIRVEYSEPGNPQSPLVYKGVVYNEMKGAMSSPHSILSDVLNKYVFPTTTYHFNSGGDPASIPDLGYEDLVAFYRKHYHPSNAVFMTYGDIPAAEHQARFEELALHAFSRGEPVSGRDEKRYAAPVAVEEFYPLDEGDDGRKSHVVLSWLLGQTADVRDRLAMHLLTGVLLENSASPLRHYLETCGLGESPSPMCGLDDNGREMSFSCGLEGCEADSAREIEDGILNVLRDVAANGVPQEDVEAVLHQVELSQREIGGDSYPYGLQLILNGLGAALQDSDPLPLWDVDAVLAELRAAIADPAYIRRLLQEKLLDNVHRVRLTLKPDTGLNQRQQQFEAQRLEKIRASLTEERRQEILSLAESLAERQNQVDDVSILPKVGLADVPADLKIAEGGDGALRLRDREVPLTTFAAGTNGLFYHQIIIDLPELAEDEQALLPLYAGLFSELGAGEHDYLAMQQWQSRVSGGVRMGLSLRSSLDDPRQGMGHLVVSSKALHYNTDCFALVKKTLQELRFDEGERVREFLGQRKARFEAGITDSGHALAMQTASQGMSAVSALEYRISGLPSLLRLRGLVQSVQEEAGLSALLADLGRLHAKVLASPRRYLLIAQQERLSELSAALQSAWSDVAAALAAPSAGRISAPAAPGPAHTAWLVNSQVQFCAAAYPAVPVDHPDAPAFMVLGGFLRNGFLHRAIREQGGAYGGGAGYDGNACAFRFYSYRDPRLEGTYADFLASLDWLQQNDHEERQLEEAILGIVASMDKPMSPAGEARSAFHNSLYGRTPAQRRKMRASLLKVTIADLQSVAARYLRPEVMTRGVIAPYALAGELEGMGFRLEKL